MIIKEAYIELLEARVLSLDAAASALCDAVERYVSPKPGDEHCLRSELLNTKDRLRQALKR